jgi:hypothetical protein
MVHGDGGGNPASARIDRSGSRRNVNLVAHPRTKLTFEKRVDYLDFPPIKPSANITSGRMWPLMQK